MHERCNSRERYHSYGIAWICTTFPSTTLAVVQVLKPGIPWRSGIVFLTPYIARVTYISTICSGLSRRRAWLSTGAARKAALPHKSDCAGTQACLHLFCHWQNPFLHDRMRTKELPFFQRAEQKGKGTSDLCVDQQKQRAVASIEQTLYPRGEVTLWKTTLPRAGHTHGCGMSLLSGSVRTQI
jgi:hypothetical protein